MASPPPRQLNGYPVIASYYCGNGYHTIMVQRHGDPMPYVVATWWEALKTQWQWGHYCETMQEANDKMREVTARNRSRTS